MQLCLFGILETARPVPGGRARLPALEQMLRTGWPHCFGRFWPFSNTWQSAQDFLLLALRFQWAARAEIEGLSQPAGAPNMLGSDQ